MPSRPPGPRPEAPAQRKRGLLASLRIRKKLMLLHTVFSLALAGVLLVPLRPALERTVALAESDEATHWARLLAEGRVTPVAELPPAITIEPADASLSSEHALALAEAPGEPTQVLSLASSGAAAVRVESGPSAGDWVVRVRHTAARSAANTVFILALITLFAVYALVAVALELFVLPRHVYDPIRRMLRADRAVQDGDKAHELIPESRIPADELGEIMRSRNDTVRALRRHEADLADALDRFEQLAMDLRRKNHLLENARRNLEGADRLASLGMMSAGIAHELNTPLAVATGLADKLEREGALPDTERALLKRVIGRLERLSEGLLDFARARPPTTRPAPIAEVIDEAVTLVRLDRESSDVDLTIQVPRELVVACDADRMVQVFVNLIRNAVDAMRASSVSPESPRLSIAATTETRDEADWLSVTITDNGPGIDPEVLPSLFEPFVSTRLDARGTGLGLAVADGIVREHAGMILARNRPGRSGAVFEVILPVSPPVARANSDTPTEAGAHHG